MCGRVLSSRYRGEFAASKSRRICVMCVKALRHRVDPVLALDQFSVARPLQSEDLDRRVTRQGVYPLLPAPNGIPWSEYVRTHRNRPQSISFSMEALESDHARYVTSTIAQHARSMATHTRSLPTDSPIPFQLVERGYMSEGSQGGITPYRVPSEHTINIGGTDYHSEITIQIECQPLQD